MTSGEQPGLWEDELNEETYEWDGTTSLPRNALTVQRKAREWGWETLVTVNDEHQSAVVRFRRDDALPGFASWKGGNFAGAVVSNWPWAVRINFHGLMWVPLTFADVKAYLEDPEVIYGDGYEGEDLEGFEHEHAA